MIGRDSDHYLMPPNRAQQVIGRKVALLSTGVAGDRHAGPSFVAISLSSPLPFERQLQSTVTDNDVGHRIEDPESEPPSVPGDEGDGVVLQLSRPAALNYLRRWHVSRGGAGGNFPSCSALANRRRASSTICSPYDPRIPSAASQLQIVRLPWRAPCARSSSICSCCFASRCVPAALDLRASSRVDILPFRARYRSSTGA